MDILTNVRRDRPATLREIADELVSRYGAGARLEMWRPGGMRAVAAAVVKVSTENPYTSNILTLRPAKLEWWQRDNRLLGFGLAATMREASEIALAAAGRGEIERHDVTVWFDRGARRYRFFRRGGERFPPSFRPVGRELGPEDRAAFAG